MKTLLSLLSFLIINISFGQDAKDILRKSFEKCQSIQSGYYEMSKQMVYMTQTDTSKSGYHCHFKKLPDDKIFSVAFHYKKYYNGEYTGGALYTGDDLAYYNAKDSTGVVTSKAKWTDHINNIKHNYDFYDPFINTESYPLPREKKLKDKENIFTLVGEEMINHQPTYHVRMDYDPKKKLTGDEPSRYEINYWISKNDFIPVQYTIDIDMIMNNDTLHQYEKIILGKYEIGSLNADELLTLQSIPAYFKLKDYVPYERPVLLEVNTPAPLWSFPSLTDETLNLEDLKGHLVLLDFFYKSCHPCMQALPALQSLHEKYGDQGLKVIGINPFDTKEDNLDSFLAKRGVTYDVVYASKQITKDYHVSGYPTFYLINKEGRIIHAGVGYGEKTEKNLEKIIQSHL